MSISKCPRQSCFGGMFVKQDFKGLQGLIPEKIAEPPM